MSYDAIVLSGGAARRLGGADKASLVVGGQSLAHRVAAAVGDAHRLIVVGPWPGEGTGRAAVVTREHPPLAGPVAAIAAGAAHVRSPEVAVLAADQPFLTAAAIAALRARRAADGAGVAFPVDGSGRDQPLCSVWKAEVLRAALEAVGDPAGVPVRRLTEAAGRVTRVAGLGGDGSRPPPWFDCDTPDDLARAERWT